MSITTPVFDGTHFSVRTLEKGAHLRRNRRDFPRCALSKTGAHLRSKCAPSNQGTALDPVPLTRKVAQPLASASKVLFGYESWLGLCRRRWAHLAVSSPCGQGPQEKSGPGAHGHTSLDEDEGIIELIGEPFWPEGQGCGITFPGGYVSWSRDFERLLGC